VRNPATPELLKRPRSRPTWLIWGLTLLVTLLAAMTWGSARWAAVHARAEADRVALQMAGSHAGLLGSELQKFRLLPLVLSEYPDARSVLETPDAETVQRLNGKLELLARRTDASAIYVIRADGLTVATSNWQLPASFMGQNFGFRPYFRGALAHGNAELFALGAVSHRPGLFIARRIGDSVRPLGVIVVKVEFDRLERQWAGQPGVTLVSDPHGVVIITSQPAARFRTIAPLAAAARREIQSSSQFGSLTLDPLGLEEDATGDIQVGRSQEEYRRGSAPVALHQARLSYLEPFGPALASAAASARVAVLTAFIVIALALAWFWRAHVRRVAQAESRRALEHEVASRTRELSDTNARLVAASEAREAAGRRLRAAREELAQANRLAAIGQITAGVAHEINQPVAAIRTFAENARLLLGRQQTDRTDTNLSHIVDLTDRIGRITAELRSYARRGTPVLSAVALDKVIEGALLLTGDRMRAVGVEFTCEGDDPSLSVLADRVRLEQVLINLIQNAQDAVAGVANGRIALRVSASAKVEMVVADNGPGIDRSVADAIFTPFVSTKTDGLGLGLGIARDIAREFGGELDVVPSWLGGAAFRITLRRA